MSNEALLKLALVLVMSAGGASTTLPASAADQGPQRKEEGSSDKDRSPAATELDEIIVTGTRIARPRLEAAAPILIGEEDFQAQGMENFADLAAQLPQFAPAFQFSRTQSSFTGGQGSALNFTNLRNLFATSTLVLLNGRRVPGGTTLLPAVDFNTIPTANIERIEVLTGGASAVYGADAVAGVVNIITKRNFEGVEFGASYGATQKGDNKNPSAYMMIGGSFAERGSGLFTIQYDMQDRVSCADRFLCQEDFIWVVPETQVRGPNAYASQTPAGVFFLPDGRQITSRNGSFTDANGDLIDFETAIDGYNRAPMRDLAIPTERFMVAAEGSYALSDQVSAFVELNFGQSDTDSQIEPHNFASSSGGNVFGGGAGRPGVRVTIPLSNPFVPTAFRDAYLAANPAANPATAEIAWQQRFTFAGFRGFDNTRQTIRAAAGLGGAFGVPWTEESWSWELSHVYGRTTLESESKGIVGTDKLYYGLRVEPDPLNPGQFRCIDAAARSQGCIPINPFAPYTEAMGNYLKTTAGASGTSELKDTLAYVRGALFALPAGQVQTVFGLERRTFSGFLDYDDVINRALVTHGQNLDFEFVETEAKEAFIEARIPVLRDLPFADSLSLEGAYRRSRAEQSANNEELEYNTWNYGADWAPIEGMSLHVMRSRAVRAPSPGELSGLGQTFSAVLDPCAASRRNANATRAANCLADGVPDTYVPPAAVEVSVPGLTGGNPALEPEIATTLTYGFSLTPTFLPEFSLAVDRFEIDIDGVVTSVGRQQGVNLCYDTPDRLFCDQVSRGANPLVPDATYVLVEANQQLRNAAFTDIRGIDVQANYFFNVGTLGRFDLRALMTFYDKAQIMPLPNGLAGVDDLLGAAGGAGDNGYLKKQGVLNLTYTKAGFSANWRTRYIDRADMSPFVEGFPQIGSHVYHDARLGFTFNDDDTEVYVGVTNVFDKQPPFFATGSSGTPNLDTVPGYYDVFGRSFFGGARVKF